MPDDEIDLSRFLDLEAAVSDDEYEDLDDNELLDGLLDDDEESLSGEEGSALAEIRAEARELGTSIHFCFGVTAHSNFRYLRISY
jgi:hypothetical protein